MDTAGGRLPSSGPPPPFLDDAPRPVKRVVRSHLMVRDEDESIGVSYTRLLSKS